VVTNSTSEILVIRDGLGIFSGTSNAFPGFSSYQPIPSTAAPAGRILSAAGTSDTSPSIIGYQLGHGVVVEVGLAGFSPSLSHSVDAQQLTRRLWTILGH
jgi:hypothetical protein